jgi:hypothetical protein
VSLRACPKCGRGLHRNLVMSHAPSSIASGDLACGRYQAGPMVGAVFSAGRQELPVDQGDAATCVRSLPLPSTLAKGRPRRDQMYTKRAAFSRPGKESLSKERSTSSKMFITVPSCNQCLQGPDRSHFESFPFSTETFPQGNVRLRLRASPRKM